MKALLILDVQNDFTSINARFPVAPDQALEIITNINKLTANIHLNTIIPVYIGNEFSKYDLFNIFRNWSAIRGTFGCQLDARLNVINDIYFRKNSPNAFVNPEFDSFLKKNDINELYFSGLFAEACVWATLKAALRKDYKVNLVSDAVATSTERKRAYMIEKYHKLGVNVLSSNEVITKT